MDDLAIAIFSLGIGVLAQAANPITTMAPTPAPFTSIALYDLNDSTTAFPLVVAARRRTTVRQAALILMPRIHLPRICIVIVANFLNGFLPIADLSIGLLLSNAVCLLKPSR